MANITVKKDLLERLENLQKENGHKSMSETLEFMLERTESVEKVELDNNDSLEVVLSETEQESNQELQELFSNDNIEKKTDLSTRQVVALAKAKTFADRYNNKPLDDFINRFVVYAVSKNRQGRTEFVESFKAKILEPLGMFGGSHNAKNNESK